MRLQKYIKENASKTNDFKYRITHFTLCNIIFYVLILGHHE